MTQVLMCAMPSSLPTPTPSETSGFQQGDPIVISGAQRRTLPPKVSAGFVAGERWAWVWSVELMGPAIMRYSIL